jgi:type II secretory pathway predicted ATPase ExeA
MFFDHYLMLNRPFVNNLPLGNNFMSNQIFDIKEDLLNSVNNYLFALLTGEFGVGKTTLLGELKYSLSSRFDFFYIVASELTPLSFYNIFLAKMGMKRAHNSTDARRKFFKYIDFVHSTHYRRIVVVVDDAHLLHSDMLAELRFLLNFEINSLAPFALILSGHSVLDRYLHLNSAASLGQLVSDHLPLLPLTLDETLEYINYQMYTYAQANKPIFTDEAVTKIYSYSSGLPSLINKACINCLILACNLGALFIDEHIVTMSL